MTPTVDATGAESVGLLTRRALAGCGLAAIGIAAVTGWLIAVVQVVAQTGAFSGVQAYAALISAIFGAMVGAFAAFGAFLALGTGGTLGWRPVAFETVGLGVYVFAVAAAGYAWAARDRPDRTR
ncbi:hypothetical protein [Pseudolysinimonas sp.]|uniref:hypothetical protein n=1 Tax=Pseudolysinimonas sp. TaxID=2680009 RepID=UPI00286BFB49|nr:hypothetical protein [Pseudolysinimonas sp.]